MIEQSDRSEQISRDPVAIAEFAKFYKESFPKLVAFLRLVGAPYAVAVDCVQDTMFKALPPIWETLTNPYAWCRTTCRRAYLRHVTRNREDPVPHLDDTDHPLIAPETNLKDLEERFEVVRLLNQLSPRRRQVMAHIYDNASYEEIAEALDISPATARTTCRDARMQLAELLREKLDGDR